MDLGGAVAFLAMSLDFSTPPQRVCIIRLSAIGDTCHTLPAIRALKAAWPDTQFTWIIGKTEATLLDDIADIEFIVFDKSQGLRAFSDLRRRLKVRRFDVLLHMHASMRANLVSLAIRAPLRVGFDRARARDYQWLFTNRKIPARSRRHVMDGLFEFAEFLGVRDWDIRWDIPISDADRSFAQTALAGQGPTLAISPCSSQRFRNFRNWSADNYAAIADYFAERYGGRTIVTGGPTDLERHYGAEIERQTRCEPINLVGETTLKQLLAILNAATVLVCPDSGPAHMATTVATPVVGLYATSNTHRTGPYNSQQLVVDRYPTAVAEEFGKRVEQMPWGVRVRNPDAMDLISIDDVKRALDRALSAA